MTQLWVDDMKDPAIAASFFSLDGVWTWAKTAEQARALLFSADIRPTVLALDNDLGLNSDADGRDLATEMLNRTLDDLSYVPPTELYCISFNPVAEHAILATFSDIVRAVALRG